MRVVKEAAERRNEILDVAEKLFCQKGYEQTSTKDILKEIGIARGTLYYHFKSKEDILDAMIERMTAELVARAATIAQNKEIPVLQRVTMSVMALNVDSELGQEVMEQVHKPQNALMHQKMQQEILEKVDPIIAGLIREACEQGICNTDYPEEAAEMIMIYTNTAFDDLAQNSAEQQQRKMIAFVYHLERILDMKQGSMMETILPLFQKNNRM